MFTPSLLPSLTLHGPTSLPASVNKLLPLLKTEGFIPSQSSAGGHRLPLFSIPHCVWLWQPCACPCLGCGCGVASQSPCPCPAAAGLRGACGASRRCRQLCRGLPPDMALLQPQGLTPASATCAGQSLGPPLTLLTPLRPEHAGGRDAAREPETAPEIAAVAAPWLLLAGQQLCQGWGGQDAWHTLRQREPCVGSLTTLAPASPPLPPRAVTLRGGSPEPDVCQSHSVTCA